MIVITSALAFVFVWSLSYGRVPHPWQLLLCVGLAIALAVAGWHRHEGFISIDIYAQGSRLKSVNPTLKLCTLLALVIICIASGTAITGVFLTLAALVLAVLVGGLRMREYVRIIALPASFLLVAGLALLFDVSSEPGGLLNLPIFGFWLSVSTTSQDRTALIVSRALGAVSCLTLLSVTTPMPDIISTMRKAHCPDLVIDLMYLIYRYIFILLSLHHTMHDAATSRLGFRNYGTSMHTTGKLYANLLARSYQLASKNFDAMESRCYDTGIRFLEHKKELKPKHIITSVTLLAITSFLAFAPIIH